MLHSYETLTKSVPLPLSFVLRRLHSLLGFFLVLFLFEHLLTNSQAAFFIGDDGKGFIDAVNFIHSLPYLPVIEIALLAAPFLIHALLGAIYVWTAALNSFPWNGSRPALTSFGRNHAYTWQRITAVIILVGLIFHIAGMRFINYPSEVKIGGHPSFLVTVSHDSGLYTLAPRLNVELFDQGAINQLSAVQPEKKVARTGMPLDETGQEKDYAAFVHLLKGMQLAPDDVVVRAHDFGTACLLGVRDTFKSSHVAIVYAIFVLAAAFHALNGIWTFCITWGITQTEASRKYVRHLCNGAMVLFVFFGFGAIFATFWINLRR